jgi:L-amino acid N-acyltransferase YncA
MVAVQRTYAPHVLGGLATFEEVPPSSEELLARWHSVTSLGLPYLVAQRDGEVVGYSYAGPYRLRPAYRYTVEESVYVATGCGRQGIGTALLRTLIERCEAGPWRQMIAVIGDSGNNASVALHTRMGFRPIGIFRSVGFKLDRWVDSVLMQRSLGEGDRTRPDPPPDQMTRSCVLTETEVARMDGAGIGEPLNQGLLTRLDRQQ